ncbi:hypothetical protein Hanom_Chr05g00403131 [Helianthus anomalus]
MKPIVFKSLQIVKFDLFIEQSILKFIYFFNQFSRQLMDYPLNLLIEELQPWCYCCLSSCFDCEQM